MILILGLVSSVRWIRLLVSGVLLVMHIWLVCRECFILMLLLWWKEIYDVLVVILSIAFSSG